MTRSAWFAMIASVAGTCSCARHQPHADRALPSASTVSNPSPSTSVASAATPTTHPEQLRPEPYYFRLVEHQFRLSRLLDALAPNHWMHDMDLSKGTLTFVDAASRKPLLTSRVRLLGTFGGEPPAWMWGWAIDVAEQNPGVVQGFGALRELARAQGRGEFSSRAPVSLSTPAARQLMVTTAGALGLWAYYALDSDDGVVVYLGLEDCPEVDAAPFEPPARVNMLMSTAGWMPMDLHLALESYLGPPVRGTSSSPEVDYPFGSGAPLHVAFDSQGRITTLETTMEPDAAGSRRP